MKYLYFTFSIVLLFNLSLSSQEKIRPEHLSGLKVGEQVESFSALTAANEVFNLNDALKEGPVVLIFYRGFWCPYCNKHLEILQDSLVYIQSAGAQIVAISPEKPEFLNKMIDKTGAQFTLLYDEDYKIEDAFGLTFNPGKSQLMMYNGFLGAKLKKSHSDDSQRLPIPATFIIDEDGRVVWRHFDPDYKKRSSVKNILKFLDELK